MKKNAILAVLQAKQAHLLIYLLQSHNETIASMQRGISRLLRKVIHNVKYKQNRPAIFHAIY